MKRAILQPGKFGDIFILQGLARQKGVTHWICHKDYREIFRHFDFEIITVNSFAYEDSLSACFDAGIYDIIDTYFGMEGHHRNKWIDNPFTFDKLKYELNGSSIDKKWEGFEWRRDRSKEAEVLKYFKVDSKDVYNFVHDDPESHGPVGLVWNALFSKIKTYGIEIRPERLKGITICDYYLLLKNANEIHCIDSAFSNFCELALPEKKGSMFVYPGKRKHTRKGRGLATYRNVIVK